ncbi:MAG: hypothetical protein KA765_03185 [Thermoflexales bacterium]|nr:hypothetical protein [Thermoflexales bacterium]
MKPFAGLGLRRAIKRAAAERLMLLMLLSFAASVVLTRIYLQLTGYPQIGGGELHIAHMLWGGLLLFIGALLLLLIANRWMQPIGAILTGIGVGLFIDEVGKFITKSNDYFYPIAAPIIYGFFLLTVWLYLQLRRRKSNDIRSELSQALEYLTEVVDDDMDVRERAEIDSRLQRVAARATSPDQIQLATTLLQFIRRDDLHLVQHPANRWERLLYQLQRIEAQYISRRTAKTVLIIGLSAFGLLAIQDLLPVVRALFSRDFANELGNVIVSAGLVRNVNGLLWYLARQVLEGLVGVSLISGASLLLANRERLGLQAGYIGLVFYLLTVNLLVLYFDQFTTILLTVLQFGLLLALMRYRQRYLTTTIMHHQ